MTYQPVPALSIAGMVFTLLICFGLPIGLFILLRVRGRARVSPFFIGALTFVVFALLLEQLLHSVVLKVAAPLFQANLWLYALYGGFAAALFEETGRCVAMRFVLKKGDEPQNALMYGAGHGGIEAMLITGVTYINNLSYTALINSGRVALVSPPADAASKEAYLQTLTALSTSPGGLFFIAGVERLIAITLHICLSVLIYTAFKRHQKRYVLLAFLLHLVIDAGSIILSSVASPLIVEAALLIAVALLGVYTVKLYRASAAAPVSPDEPEPLPPQ